VQISFTYNSILLHLSFLVELCLEISGHLLIDVHLGLSWSGRNNRGSGNWSSGHLYNRIHGIVAWEWLLLREWLLAWHGNHQSNWLLWKRHGLRNHLMRNDLRNHLFHLSGAASIFLLWKFGESSSLSHHSSSHTDARDHNSGAAEDARQCKHHWNKDTHVFFIFFVNCTCESTGDSQ